ncbi:MAG: LysR family transcriptional regulator [Parvibaculaceae bacterium]
MHPNLLDQLQVFDTVAELGTFSAAARKLNRTVSAIAYSIGQLENQLDLTLFDRSGYRPVLTEEGKSLRRDAEIISRRIERLSARADALKRNISVNATLLVEAIFPRAPLAAALGAFAKRHPQIQLSILDTPSDQIIPRLSEGEADLILLALNDLMPMRTFDGRQITLRGAHPVAAPSHPLARTNAPFPLAELDNHRQIILSSRGVDEGTYNYHVHVTDLWAVNSVPLALDLLRQGIGWAYMPHDSVAEDLASGSLVALDCADIHDWAALRFSAAWRTDSPPDEALSELLDLIEEACDEGPGATRLSVS